MKPATLISRLAPTPSGHLHLGNLANFLFIEKLVADAKGQLALRIDDCDGTRARREFVEQIFETLHWLGIHWQHGPKNVDDFYAHFSQVTRKDYYFQKLQALSHLTYACACSRKELEAGECACREKKLEFVPGTHALRLPIENPALAQEFGDVVLWRKDDGPAYHWASVIDDLDAGVDLIVRGEDLRSSSELQKQIAALVKPGGFEGVKFIHHPLLTDAEGNKLSKSQGSLSVQELRSGGATPAALRKKIETVILGWGLS